MTGLLVKCSVKNYNQVDEIQVQIRYGMLTSVMGIDCNILPFAARLFIGVLVDSISVMTDAFDNLSGAASSVIDFIGVKMAEKPADDNHPLGHGRIEYTVTFIVAFLVIQVGFSSLKTSIGKVSHSELMSSRWISIIIPLLSIGVKLWLSLFNKRLGKRINSKVMLAAVAGATGDVTTIASTVRSIDIYGVLGPNVDDIAGSIVSVTVMIAGVNIAEDTLAPLIGEGTDPEVYGEVSNSVKEFGGIVGTYDLIVHSYGSSRGMASIYAEAPNDCDVEYSREITDRIEREAMRRLHMLLVIHMDPMEAHDERVMELKDMVAEVLENIDGRLAFHDFRMIDGQEKINLISDLAIPQEYKQAVQGKLKVRISDEVEQRDRRCKCVIAVGDSFMSGSRE